MSEKDELVESPEEASEPEEVEETAEIEETDVVEEVEAEEAEETPPELSADLVDLGIVMAGGGALLRGLHQVLAEQTLLPVRVAKDPLTAVARGTGVFLEQLDLLRGRLRELEEA